MRKFAAILLIVILLFSLGGYRMVISLLQNKAALRLETRLDNSNYDESQLIEIRVALNMPYQERYTEFERHYGEIEIDGKSYTYVKSKVEGDVLILKCIANEAKEQLKTVNNGWVTSSFAVDIDHSGPIKSQQQNPSFAKSFWTDYDDQHFFYSLHCGDIISTKLFSNPFLHIPEVILNTPHQPPEALPVSI